MDNFTPIRNGLNDHIKAGRISPFDLGIYLFLHMHADWATGIYTGCALTIAYAFQDLTLKEHIQKALRRLRERQYINYRKGDGTRGGYSILINKYEPRVGELCGTRLNAWKHGELIQPEYELWNGGGTVMALPRHGEDSVMAPIQEDNQEVQEVIQEVKRTPNPACERIYNAYPRKVGKAASLKAISKALASTTEEFLYSQVVKFAESPAGQRGQYTPYPATWFNQERYNDDPSQWYAISPSDSGPSKAEQREAANIGAYQQFARGLEAKNRAAANDSGGGTRGNTDGESAGAVRRELIGPDCRTTTNSVQ